MKLSDKIRNEGIRAPLKRRLGWYWARLRVNNPSIGRLIEIFGNHAFLDGHRYSLDCPLLTTGSKSTIFFGLHEIEERALAKSWIRPEIPVVELGGGLGVVSCLTNSKLSNQVPHIVVEANPLMTPVLERNRMLNKCSFKILSAALGYDNEHIHLKIEEGFVASSAFNVADSDGLKVRTTSLGDLLAEENLTTVQVICDIEGLESELIRREIIPDQRVVALLVEMHPKILGDDEVQQLLSELANSGFALKQTIGDVSFLQRS